MFFFINLLLTCLTSCSNNSPKQVAQEFAQALYEGNFDKAKQYCTPETRDGFNFLSKIAESDDYKKNKPTNVSILVEDCKIAEDESEASVFLSITSTTPKEGEKTEQTKIDLLKYDGEWMVRFKAK